MGISLSGAANGSQYGSLELNARNAGKGLWSDPHAVEPRQWRKANN